MEIKFDKYGDAYYALDEFFKIGESKDYVSWNDMIDIFGKTETVERKVFAVNHINEGWLEAGDARIEPLDDSNWDGKWKLILPSMSILKFNKKGEIIYGNS